MNLIKYSAILPNGLETTAAINADLVAQILPFLNDEGELTHIQLLMNLPTDIGWEPYPVKGKFDKYNKVILDKRGNQEVTFQNKQIQKHVFIVIRRKEDMENVLSMFDYNVSSYKFPTTPEPSAEEVTDAILNGISDEVNTEGTEGSTESNTEV